MDPAQVSIYYWDKGGDPSIPFRVGFNLNNTLDDAEP